MPGRRTGSEMSRDHSPAANMTESVSGRVTSSTEREREAITACQLDNLGAQRFID